MGFKAGVHKAILPDGEGVGIRARYRGGVYTSGQVSVRGLGFGSGVHSVVRGAQGHPLPMDGEGVRIRVMYSFGSKAGIG